MHGLRDRILRAHGGEQRWTDVGKIMACASMGGLEFASRLHFNPLTDVDVLVDVTASSILLSPYPDSGGRGGYAPKRAWLEDEHGECVAERVEPEVAFRTLRRWLLWDHLDVAYYAGALLAQTLQLPGLLLREGATLEEQTPVTVGDERWYRLRVTLPDGALLLANEHTVYCDGAGLIRRVDYSSGLYGSIVKVAQLWEGHESVAGAIVPARCTVHPFLASGQPWRMTTLSWLELSDFALLSGSSRAEPRSGSRSQ